MLNFSKCIALTLFFLPSIATAQNVPPTPPMMEEMIKECRVYYASQGGKCLCPDQDGCKGNNAYKRRDETKRPLPFCYALLDKDFMDITIGQLRDQNYRKKLLEDRCSRRRMPVIIPFDLRNNPDKMAR
jgi:hypothetical protein